MTASKDDFHFWQRPSFNLLSQAQLDHIYAAALEMLARVGGEFPIIHDLGYLDSGMTSSLELLVICNEMVSQIRRFMQEIPVTPETLAMDTIAAIGLGNHYLTHRQTKAHYREQIWRPELISRKRYDAWEAEGELTLRQRARTKLLKIMETHQPQPLAPDLLQEVAALLKTAGAARTVS